MKRKFPITLLLLLSFFQYEANEKLSSYISFTEQVLQPDTTIKSKGISVSPAHIHFNVEPGNSKTQKITINNRSDKSYKFSVNMYDFDMDKKGETPLLPAGQGAYSLSKWATLTPTFIEVPADSKKQINLTLNVPTGPEGERSAWSIVMIEQVLEKTLLDPADGDDESVGLGVIPVFAFGVYLYQNPPNVNISGVEMKDFNLEGLNDTTNVFKLEIENTGNGISYCKTFIELTNYNTGEQVKLPLRRFTILPGLLRNFSFKLPNDLEAGDYSAVGVVDFGSKEEIQVAELNFAVE